MPSTSTPLRPLRLRLALFLSGAAVMVLQILGTRLIAPQFGSGLNVWTALITVTLVALALGYWQGGGLADRRPHAVTLSAVLLVAAVLVALIPWLRLPVLELGWTLGLRWGALFSSFLLFFPPLFLLGMVSPFAIRLEAAEVATAGRSAGRLYAISTSGSVVGALLAGLVLVPHLRLPVLLAGLAWTLILAALLVASPDRRRAVAAAGIAGFALLPARPQPRPPGLLEACYRDGSDLRVIEHEGNRYLFADQTVQSGMAANGRSLDKYAYFLAARVLMARPQATTGALIGLGGGGMVPLLSQGGMDWTGVDLSPEVIRLAQRHFGLSLPDSRLHAMDGRVFLHLQPGQFDVVVLDAFNGDSLAWSLISREGLATAKAALAPGGLLAVNTWGIDERQGAPNRLGSAVRATLQEVFVEVLAVPADGNLLFFASDQPIRPERGPVTLACFDGPRTFQWLQVPSTAWEDVQMITDERNFADLFHQNTIEILRSQRYYNYPQMIRAALAWE